MEDKILDAYSQEVELTDEQKACLKYTGERTLMVKGYAGAGKSLVLMAIAKKYLEAYGKNSVNKVAIFTFQNTLVTATSEFLHVNGQSGDGAKVSTINSHIKQIYEYFVGIGLAPSRKFLPTSFKTYDKDAIRRENVEVAIQRHKNKYGKHRFHDLPLQFWLEEFDWMKEMNVWKDDLDYYLALKRVGRGGKVRMSTPDRVIAYQLFSIYCDYLDEKNYGDWADQTLFVVRHSKRIPDSMKYEHVLVDEAQDLSLAQMTAIMYLYTKDMTVAMDMNQKIHSKNWNTKQLGIESTTKKLTQSMRTTKQIDNLAESVRCKNDSAISDDDKSLRAIPVKDGDMPEVVHLDDDAAERKYVINLVREYLKQPKITIGIIAAKNDQIKTYSTWLTDEGIPHEQITRETTFSMAKPGVKVVSAFGAKGLEFNCVIIPMFKEGYFPYRYTPDDEEELEQYLMRMRNLVYVSMTRAKDRLIITYSGNNGSRFLADMDPSLYIAKGNPISVNAERDSIRASVVLPKTVTIEKISPDGSLADYFKKNGFEVIDKRSHGGALWVVGDQVKLNPYLKEARSLYGAVGSFTDKGKASGYRMSWFTKCNK